LAKKKSNVKSSSSKVKSHEFTTWQKVKIFLLVLLVFVGLVAIFASLKGMSPRLLGGASLSGKLAAEVNGEQITITELDESYDRLPMQYKMAMTREEFLNQMIDNVLLRQRAAEVGIVVSDFEADQNVKEFMQQSQISDEELQELLKNKSLDYDELVRISRDQLLVQRVIAMEITSQVEPTTADALDYYNQNIEDFTVPGIITVRHILFATEMANRTIAQADAEAERVMALVKDDKSNFCDLVNEYTDDRASVSLCGEYQFPEGQLPEEFDTWSESATIGSLDVVSTPYGAHVLLLVNKTPESYVLFRDVQDQILASLERGDEQQAYNTYVTTLRENADIKIYLKDAQEEATVQGVMPSENVQETPVQETVVEVPVEEVTTEEAPTPEDTSEDPVAAPVSSTTTVTVQSNNQFIQCLAEKNAVLYGAKWDSSTSQQKMAFGASAMEDLTYIECAVDGDYKTQTDACQRAGIVAYPTWIIGGRKYLGVHTPQQLAEAAGC
jgi:parvulin-like peptidyl-prolyl isomerase